jgi:hypothetical protein
MTPGGRARSWARASTRRMALVGIFCFALTSCTGAGGPVAHPDGIEKTPTGGNATLQTVDYVATDNGLSMKVSLDDAHVVAGSDLNLTVVANNARPMPVVLSMACGAPAVVTGLVPLPLDPNGLDWDGVAATFKQFATSKGHGPGAVPALAPVEVGATGECPQDQFEMTLAPGDSTTSSLAWKAQIVGGVPAQTGVVPLEISIGHDPTGAPPSYPPDYIGLHASWSKAYKQLAVAAAVDVVDGPTKLTSAGQALDALLSNERFANWLLEEPPESWEDANLFLTYGDGSDGIAPKGPSWEVDLFRSVDGARSWAIGFVDPFSGGLQA